jgi:hypothetical protein
MFQSSWRPSLAFRQGLKLGFVVPPSGGICRLKPALRTRNLRGLRPRGLRPVGSHPLRKTRFLALLCIAVSATAPKVNNTCADRQS